MKQVLSVVWQAVVLYVAAFAGFVAGVAVPALRVSRVVSHTAGNIRTYDFDWLIAVMLIYVVLLLIGVARGRLRSTWVATTVALAVVIVTIFLFTQLGVKNTQI